MTLRGSCRVRWMTGVQAQGLIDSTRSFSFIIDWRNRSISITTEKVSTNAVVMLSSCSHRLTPTPLMYRKFTWTCRGPHHHLVVDHLPSSFFLNLFVLFVALLRTWPPHMRLFTLCGQHFWVTFGTKVSVDRWRTDRMWNMKWYFRYGTGKCFANCTQFSISNWVLNKILKHLEFQIPTYLF